VYWLPCVSIAEFDPGFKRQLSLIRKNKRLGSRVG
jgi:hypothetical protein